MKLELKYIAPYLPYNLKCNVMGETEQEFEDLSPTGIVFEIKGLDYMWMTDDCDDSHMLCDCIPILHPIKDLKTMFEDEDTWIDKFREYACLDWCDIYEDAIRHIDETIYTEVNIQALPYQLMEWLLSLHIDVFELINEGLAVDINTL